MNWLFLKKIQTEKSNKVFCVFHDIFLHSVRNVQTIWHMVRLICNLEEINAFQWMSLGVARVKFLFLWWIHLNYIVINFTWRTFKIKVTLHSTQTIKQNLDNILWHGSTLRLCQYTRLYNGPLPFIYENCHDEK